jgi:glutamate racemase
MNDDPVGIFDSGIGGLTVAKEVIDTLPDESYIYLGDTARVPYGTRGTEVITQFALELARFLLKRNVKALVVACNTISSTCLDAIESVSSVPVIGVLKPAVAQALDTTKTGRIGVIGTRATVNSGVYEREIRKLEPEVEVISQACPLFVSLAEEGFLEHESTRLIARDYLAKFRDSGIDTLILGCTHYPILRKVIQETVGEDVTLIDSARPTAEEVAKVLREEGLSGNVAGATRRFFVTDDPERVRQVADLFFGNHLSSSLTRVSVPE